MMKFKDWVQFLSKLAPLNMALTDDNSGKQMGYPNKNIQKMVICLDANEKVINFAIVNKIDLIVSFHPLFWPNKRKNISKDPEKKAQYLKLKHAKISVFSMHTNYENLYLSKFLLEKLVPNNQVISNNLISETNLKTAITIKQIVIKCKKIFKINYLDTWIKNDELETKVSNIILISGSGGYALPEIKKLQPELLIVGDLKWHQWHKIMSYQQNTIAVGHHMEEYFVLLFMKQLKQKHYDKKCEIFPFLQGSVYKKI